MSIENSLERIAVALEIIAGQSQMDPEQPELRVDAPPAAKKATKKAAKKTTSAVNATEDELRQCFQEYVGKKGNEEGTTKLKELIGGYGATKIGEVKPKDFDAIIEEVKSWN